jgi:protein arginine kinase
MSDSPDQPDEHSADDLNLVRRGDSWLLQDGPDLAIVASSRVRFARNLPEIVFPPRARVDDLARSARIIDDAVRRSEYLTAEFHRLAVDDLDATSRAFLKESHIISNEMERGGDHRYVYLNDDGSLGMMVNEEDHLRIFSLLPGMQLDAAFEKVCRLDDELQRFLKFAWSDRYGYLSACATNAGTGMRGSVMLHLPALVITKQLERLVIGLPELGLTVRGYFGENSDFLGDHYQVSNERTLGRREQDVLVTMGKVVAAAIDAETKAREALMDERREAVEDMIWRSFAILSNARMIDTAEAAKLLSKMRLGIDHGFFDKLDHAALHRLMVTIQPGHLQMSEGGDLQSEKRDALRARLLRQRMADIARRN